jgi:hypothetical protein
MSGLRRVSVPGAYRLALAGAVVCALGLAVIRDLHGVSLTAGMGLMAGLLLVERLVIRAPERAQPPASRP